MTGIPLVVNELPTTYEAPGIRSSKSLPRFPKFFHWLPLPRTALSFQWFRQTPYMQDLGLAPLMGATVMTKKTWDRLTPDAQQKILAAAAEAEERLLAEPAAKLAADARSTRRLSIPCGIQHACPAGWSNYQGLLPDQQGHGVPLQGGRARLPTRADPYVLGNV